MQREVSTNGRNCSLGTENTEGWACSTDRLVRRAFDIRIAPIPGGGYQKKARVLTDTQREAIFLRDGYICRICGATATEVDHISGSSSDPKDLQTCKLTRAVANFRPIMLAAAELKAIWTRIAAEQPDRLWSDEEKWNKVRKEIPSAQRKRASWWTT